MCGQPVKEDRAIVPASDRVEQEHPCDWNWIWRDEMGEETCTVRTVAAYLIPFTTFTTNTSR